MKHIQLFVLFIAIILSITISALATETGDSSVAISQSNCACIKDDCGCCEYLDWSKIDINGTICSNFTYLPNDYGVSVTITYNAYTLFNETVSARNPPPFCVGIPELEKINADICLRLYDLSFAKKHFHGCMKVSVSVYHIIHKGINIGCFDLPQEAFIGAFKTNSHNVLEMIKYELEKWKELPVVNMI